METSSPAWRWGNLLLTIVAGMGSYYLWRAAFAAIYGSKTEGAGELL